MRASAPLLRRRKTTRETDEATRITTAIRAAPTTAETRADLTTAVLHSSIARQRHNGRHRVRRRSSTPVRRLSTTRLRRRHITARGSKPWQEGMWGQPPSAVRLAQPGFGVELDGVKFCAIIPNIRRSGASLRGRPKAAAPTFSVAWRTSKMVQGRFQTAF
jgi:hypothetical protein